MSLINRYRLHDRFIPSDETTQIIEAKLEALQLIDLLLIKEFNRRVAVRKRLNAPDESVLGSAWAECW